MEVVLRLSETTSSYYQPPDHHSGSSRPTLGFPLGTTVLLIIIFSLSGIFSCCYHWDKLLHLRGSLSDPDSNDSPSKSNPTFVERNKIDDQSLPVVMPGDRIAKFIGLPCPCEPPRRQNITVEDIRKPPKSQHIVAPIYLS